MDATSRFLVQNRHSEPCKQEFTIPSTRWNKQTFLRELSMHKRPSSPNRHARACTESPEDIALRTSWLDMQPQCVGQAGILTTGTPSGVSTPRSRKAHTSKVTQKTRPVAWCMHGSVCMLACLHILLCSCQHVQAHTSTTMRRYPL